MFLLLSCHLDMHVFITRILDVCISVFDELTHLNLIQIRHEKGPVHEAKIGVFLVHHEFAFLEVLVVRHFV